MFEHSTIQQRTILGGLADQNKMQIGEEGLKKSLNFANMMLMYMTP